MKTNFTSTITPRPLSAKGGWGLIYTALGTIFSVSVMLSQSQNWWRTNGNTPQNTDYLGTSNNSPLIIKTNNIERLRIAPNGFVGIANSNPQYVLDVSGRAKLRYNVYCDSLLQTSYLIANYSIQTSTIDAHQYLVNGQPAVFSQWTSISPNAIAFNGDVYVNTLNAQSGISIGNFKFKNGALPPQRDTIKSDRMVSIVAEKSIEFKADTVRFADRVGIGKQPAGNVALDVNGDVAVSGKMRIGRITSGDSLLYIGDSSIVFNHNYNRLYASPSNGRSGISIGGGNSSDGFGVASIAVGTYVKTYQVSSIGLGSYVKTSAIRAICIGTGISPTSFLENNIPNSVMIGAQSNIPSIFVAPSTNPSIFGKVGIGTTNPQRELDVNGRVRSFATNGEVEMGFNSAHAYLTGIDNTASDGKQFLINYYDPTTDVVISSNNTYVSGKLGIGVFGTPPAAMLHIKSSNGNADALIQSVNNEATIWTINGSYGYGFGVDANGNGHIWRDWNNNADVMFFDASGKVGIGTSNFSCQDPNVILAVNGHIKAKEMVIELSGWCDNRLYKGFKRMNLEEKEQYIYEHHHLPEIKSEQELSKEGIKTQEVLKGILANVEDNTVEIIELYKMIKELQKENEILKQELEKLKK